jgi:hypothetical protein
VVVDGLSMVFCWKVRLKRRLARCKPAMEQTRQHARDSMPAPKLRQVKRLVCVEAASCCCRSCLRGLYRLGELLGVGLRPKSVGWVVEGRLVRGCCRVQGAGHVGLGGWLKTQTTSDQTSAPHSELPAGHLGCTYTTPISGVMRPLGFICCMTNT